MSLCVIQMYLLPSSQPLIHFPLQECLHFLELNMIKVIKCLFFSLGTLMWHICLTFINDDFVSSLCFSYCWKYDELLFVYLFICLWIFVCSFSLLQINYIDFKAVLPMSLFHWSCVSILGFSAWTPGRWMYNFSVSVMVWEGRSFHVAANSVWGLQFFPILANPGDGWAFDLFKWMCSNISLRF